ncbi:MAG: hypothetical protein KBC62_00030 [Candidatus Pacebacteria bacterium]|nr:hypothetical protein [Candidatus Paceibacterota bacterium]MBP9842378.1 hypothetical protein [Candidatus Paceibacterota bacterium]
MNQVPQSQLITKKMGFANSLTASVLAVAILAFSFWGYQAQALDTDTVTATVTATNLAVSVTDGSIAFGSVALNTATTTVGTSQTQTVSNDGSDAALNVKSTNATNGTTWTLGTNPGSDIFKLEVSTTTGSTYATFQATDTYLTASSSFESLSNQGVDFRFTTPTISTDFVQKSLTITVQVTTP